MLLVMLIVFLIVIVVVIAASKSVPTPKATTLRQRCDNGTYSVKRVKKKMVNMRSSRPGSNVLPMLQSQCEIHKKGIRFCEERKKFEQKWEFVDMNSPSVWARQ